MTRFVPVTVLVVLMASRVASADKGMLPNNATITYDKLYIHEDGNTKLEEPDVTPDSLWKYFNLAHCQCGKAQTGFIESKFAYLLTLQNPTMAPFNPDRDLQIMVGSQCDTDNVDTRNAMCHSIVGESFSLSGLVQNNNVTVEIPVYDLMTLIPANAASPLPECTATEQDSSVWVVGALGNGTTLDYFLSKAIKTDAKAPSLPSDFRASGGDGSILISWEPPVSTVDTYAYQALCARADNDMPGKASDKPEQRYLTARGLCDLDKSVDLGTGTALPPAEGEAAVTLSDDLKNLDPAFLCGEAFNPTATSLRITGLENGVKYKVVLLTVDKFRNAAGTFFTSSVTPKPSIDFWEDLHRGDSEVEGGFCASTKLPGGGAGWISMLGVIATAWWVRRRSKRSLHIGGIVVIAVIAFGAPAAHAGGGYQPYWENDDDNGEQATAPDDPSLVKWHAGIRLGPYYPAIDKQFGTQPGPYKQMFGGYRMTPMLDVDRILWTGFGQVGVGISLGYMQVSANSFTDGSDPNDPMRPRSEGDDNTFRLIPTALTATYRFTYLDDVYGIPVVPYIRGGLSYYIWWLSADGDQVCKAGQMGPMCERNKPYGGSLGYQGSIGLSLRAERIDPDTAMSMQQSGIQHAGVYAELFLANVDGFGSATKLSVGDRTWFAGFDFEF
jgi:hypothetical protein